MIFSIEYIVRSIADMLAPVFPGVPVHDSPTQQESGFPCFFIFLQPSDIQDQLSGRDKRNLSFDVIYVQERNAPGANAQLYSIADKLDELLEVVEYSDGSGEDPVPLHTHEREYRIEDQELHYSLRITQRVTKPVEENPMQTITRLTVNDNGGGEYETYVGGDIAVTSVLQTAVLQTVGG